MPQLSRDRYDDIPEELVRVGAHRAGPGRGGGWVRFAWGALATGVLIVAGLFGLSRLDPTFRIEFPDLGAGPAPTSTSSPTNEVVPVTDPSTVPPELELSISVFNGTETAGVQNVAGDQILAAGWPDPARANASDRTEDTTVVYYRSTDFEGIALGLAELLGATQIVLSDAFPGAPVTIVIGSDYVAPAG
jgi:hypothetical protein